MDWTDRQLVQRLYNGDRGAFDQLVNRYRHMVYGLGYHLTRDFEAAQDLAQETFVQAFVKIDQLRDADRFPAWLRQIATNIWRMHRRHPEIATMVIDEADRVADVQCLSEIESVVRDALDRLREPERLALTLQYIDGYSHAEIARFMGVRPETIKTRIARARQHLRREVLDMAEEMFEEHALPPEFLDNVVQAVERLILDFRRMLPPDADVVTERLQRDMRQAWHGVLAQMPLPYGRPLREQGEAPLAPLASLPADLQRQVRHASCLTWMAFYVFGSTTTRAPWVQDFSILWIRFREQDGSHYAWFANVPGDSGYIVNDLIDDEEEMHHAPPPGADEVERALAQCGMPELTELVARLRRAVPGRPGTLSEAMRAQKRRLLRQVLEQLPVEAREATAAGQSIAVARLSDDLRELVRQAVFYDWGSTVMRNVEYPPSWLLYPKKATLEFGLYSHSIPGEAAGKEYVKLHGPSGLDALQTGIY